MLTVRRIQHSDLKQVRRMLFDLNEMHYNVLAPDYRTPEELEKLIDLNRYVDGGNELGFVAKLDDQIAGFVIGDIFERKGLVLNSIKTASIADIYVDKKYRSDGVGKKLMEFFEKEARLRGAREIMVEIYSFNQRAMEFYKSVGIEPFLVIGKKPL